MMQIFIKIPYLSEQTQFIVADAIIDFNTYGNPIENLRQGKGTEIGTTLEYMWDIGEKLTSPHKLNFRVKRKQNL